MISLLVWVAVTSYRGQDSNFWVSNGQYSTPYACHKAASQLGIDALRVRCLTDKGEIV